MTALTPEQLVEIAHTLTLGVLLCSCLGWFVGGVCTMLVRDGVFFFLRRSPRWRRFDRAMRKLLA